MKKIVLEVPDSTRFLCMNLGYISWNDLGFHIQAGMINVKDAFREAKEAGKLDISVDFISLIEEKESSRAEETKHDI